LLITGKPGCGKSTLISRVVKELQTFNIKIGGISTPDFRSAKGRRRGFLIRDVATGDEQVMAAIDISSDIHVGRYSVDVVAIRKIGVRAINQAITEADIIVIDEIGKMELAVPEFKQCVVSALNSSKPVLGTIGLFLKSAFVTSIKQRSDVNIITLSRQKQEGVYREVRALIGLPD
jgi:nucleoside-triphosphatase